MSSSSPLQVVSSYDPSLKVECMLHKTHWKRFQSEDEIVLEIFSICCQLELLCKKGYCTSCDFNQNCKMEFNNKFIPHACVEIKKITDKMLNLKSSITFQDFLKGRQMHMLFPRLWWYLHGAEQVLMVSKPIISNYFERLASLNQLKMMSQQINDDLHSLMNHKYIAHQTALLYHAIADLGIYVTKYKKEVEESFTDIKKSLNKSKDGQLPYLPFKEKQKLDHLTSDLMELSTNFDNQLFEPLFPVVNFLLSR